jgi:hypothetical protein
LRTPTFSAFWAAKFFRPGQIRALFISIGVLFTLSGLWSSNAQAQSTLTINGVTYTRCASEGQFCSFSGSAKVVFGTTSPSLMYDINGPFTNGVACSNGVVSATDPAYGYQKSCWYASTTSTGTTSPTGSWTKCASEHGTCSFSGTQPVLYGASTTSQNVSKTFTNGVYCDNSVFGDPAPGIQKSCWIPSPTSGTGSTPPSSGTGSTPPSSGTGSTPPSSGTGSTPPSSSTGTLPTGTSLASGTISCSAPVASAGGTANGVISADTPTADGTRLFPQSSPFKLAIVTAASASDTVVWSIQDHVGNVKGSGSFPVAGGTQTNTLSCNATVGGYFAVTATLSKSGGTLPQAGTRPTGIATFGILPSVSGVVPAVTFAHPDQHRFGMQGFNSNVAALHAIGVTQTLDDRELSAMEPNGPNTWTPSVANVDASYKTGNIMRLVRVDGIPGWASPTGGYQDDTHAPTDLNYYTSFMSRVGTDTETVRKTYSPNQQHNYYQVTWEPQWADSTANFINLYKAVYNGVHSTDPNAVVMGTTNPLVANCVTECTSGYLDTYGALGLANYIDGITTHGYYNSGTYPAHPPELQDTDPNPANQANALDKQMQQLRSKMQALKPNMRLWSTELGISYDAGAAYGPNYPSSNQLYAQAAVAARAHLIVLGEGAQVTYFFYGADYPNEVGYGSFFDVVHATGQFGASNLSPKPEAMAFAAMTRVIDGTQTLGRLNGLPTQVYGYAFQQLNGGNVITALWTHNNAQWPTSSGSYSPTYSTSYSLTVDAAGTSGYVTVLDMMGNASKQSYSNGVVSLKLTESPIYVVSSNASIMKANTTVPVGYTGQ